MKKTTDSSLKKSLSYLKKYRVLVALTLILAIIYISASLIIPIIIGKAIDAMIYGTAFVKDVLSHLILSAVVAVIGGVCLWFMNIVNNRITYNVTRDMRRDGFEKTHRLPISYIDSHHVGDIVSRLIADVEEFSNGMLMGFTQLFTGVLTIVSTLIFMLVLNPVIALTVTLLTPLSLFIARFISKRTHRFFSEQAKLRGEQTDYINETIENIKTIKAFSQEENASEAFGKINGRLEKSSLKATFFSSLVNPTTRFVNAVVYAAVAGVGSLFAAGIFGVGTIMITVGELSVFLQYVNQYTKPFNEISGVFAELQNALACADRIFEFLSVKEETRDCADAIALSSVKGDVTMTNVGFSYDKNKPLINDFNLNIKAGSKVAIVGPTGCGKTTLINLLLRFYDVDRGSIKIDGQDIRNITRHSLRSNYGMVLQDIWLKSGTIRENLKLGRPDATDEEMILAAKKIHCHSFITRLEHGYDTVIDETGGDLSSGQKQLLCITRAMISDPPILILDEATSSIDTRTELRVQRAMRELMNGRTSFVVAHRLSTITEVDLILVMKDGNIIEQGDHMTLLAQNGFYKTLYESRFAD